MKTVMGFISGAILGCILVVFAFLALEKYGPLNVSPNIISAADTAAVAEAASDPEPVSPSLPVKTTAVIASPAIVPSGAGKTPSAVTTSPVAATPEPLKEVDFDLAIKSLSGSGFSRQVTARLTNAGKADAHNVAIKIEAYYQGAMIKLGGKDYILQNVGNLPAGTAQTVNTTLKFSVTDGSKVLSKGADFVITISSDEKNKSLTLNYKP